MILSDEDLAGGRPGPSTAELLRISPEEYHADPAPAPSLSASIARTLLDRSPLHAHREHPKLGGERTPPSATMDRGALIHRLVLGKGADLEIVDAKDWRTKAAKEARAVAHEMGRIPVLARQHAAAKKAADAILARLVDRGVELTGESEVAIVWREAAATGDIWARGLLDHLLLDRGVIYDLKSTENAHPRACARKIVDLGYDIQAAAYDRALTALRPELVGRVRFELLFVEHEPPYDVTIARLPGVLRELGERRWLRAVEAWSGCLARDSWPGCSDGTVILEPPGWLASTMGEWL